jgi:hypothetical protein
MSKQLNTTIDTVVQSGWNFELINKIFKFEKIKYRKCSKIPPLSKIAPGVSPYKAKKNEKWELMAFLLNNFFQKKIIEKNSAMAVF